MRKSDIRECKLDKLGMLQACIVSVQKSHWLDWWLSRCASWTRSMLRRSASSNKKAVKDTLKKNPQTFGHDLSLMLLCTYGKVWSNCKKMLGTLFSKVLWTSFTNGNILQETMNLLFMVSFKNGERIFGSDGLNYVQCLISVCLKPKIGCWSSITNRWTCSR